MKEQLDKLVDDAIATCRSSLNCDYQGNHNDRRPTSFLMNPYDFWQLQQEMGRARDYLVVVEDQRRIAR